MQLGKSHFQTKEFPNLWIIPVACEDPESNYILVHDLESGFCFNYKDTVVKVPEVEDFFREFTSEILLDRDDFERNYGIESIDSCIQTVNLDWATGCQSYDFIEFIETIEQFVYDKDSGERVYDISARLYGEELIEDLTEQFNILSDKEMQELREAIAKKEFPGEELHYKG